MRVANIMKFVLGDFKYFLIKDEYALDEFIIKYQSVLDNYIKHNKKMFLITGYYYDDYIAFINDDIWTNNKLFITANIAKKKQAASILLNKLNIKKVYVLPRKQLIKSANYGDWLTNYTGDFFTVDNGSMTNPSNYMYEMPLGLKFPDFQNNYINTKNRKFGPEIDRTWEFIEPNDHPEWLMRDTY